MGIAYNTSIVRNGLVSYHDAANRKSYPGSGTAWNDLSGNGNHATLVNGPVYSTNNNGRIYFDGVNDSATTTITATNLGISTNFSVLFFTRRDPSPTNALQGHIGFGTGGSFSIKNNTTRYFADVFSTLSTRNIITITPGAAITDYEGVWIHLGVTISGTAVSTYYNGTNITNTTMDGNIKDFSTETLTHGTGFGYFSSQSYMSVCQVYNRALSSNEIQQNFNAFRGRYGL